MYIFFLGGGGGGGEDVCFRSLKNQLIKVLASAWTGMKRSFSLILMFNSPLLYGKVAKVGPCNVKAFCWEWPVALFIHWLTGRWGNILILPVPSILYLLALLPVLSQVWVELLLVNKFCWESKQALDIQVYPFFLKFISECTATTTQWQAYNVIHSNFKTCTIKNKT